MFPAMNPAISYIIGSVQRSGTHLLCSILRSTGRAGSPEEHFLSKPEETACISLIVADDFRISLGDVPGKKVGTRHRASPMCKMFCGKTPRQWSLRDRSNVELFRTNARDVAGNSGIQEC
jgi:hypothetical protein